MSAEGSLLTSEQPYEPDAAAAFSSAAAPPPPAASRRKRVSLSRQGLTPPPPLPSSLIDKPVFNKPHLHPHNSSSRTHDPALPTTKAPRRPDTASPPPRGQTANEGPTTRYTLVFARGPSSHLAPCSATRRDWVGPRCLGLIRPRGTLSLRCCPLPTPRGFRRPGVTCNPWPHRPRRLALVPRTASDRLAFITTQSLQRADRQSPRARSSYSPPGTWSDSRLPPSPPRDIGSRSCGLAPEPQKPR